MSAFATVSPHFSSLGRRALPPTIARLMALALETPGLLSLAAGFTDNATLPSDLVTETAHRLSSLGGLPEYLQYGTNQGRPALRRVLAERLRQLEPACALENIEQSILVTNGSQQALYLAAQVLCEAGDIVYVDRPSYFVFLEMLAGLGVNARSLPTNEAGEIDRLAFADDLSHLKKTGEAARLRAVYFVSYFSNPSARSMSEHGKTAVAEILASQGLFVPVLEDAAYRELYFREPHAASSVLSLPAWSQFPRLYLSTLTKPFATGLKVGYGICTDGGWLKKMLHVKGHQDFGTANFNQAVFETVFATGGFDRHLARIRPMYEAKMQALHGALERAGLGGLGWQWALPSGGLYLWLKAPPGLDTRLDEAFCRACLANGVVYVPGDLCFGDRIPRDYVRLSFGVLPPAALAEAGRRFAETARAFA